MSDNESGCCLASCFGSKNRSGGNSQPVRISPTTLYTSRSAAIEMGGTMGALKSLQEGQLALQELRATTASKPSVPEDTGDGQSIHKTIGAPSSSSEVGGRAHDDHKLGDLSSSVAEGRPTERGAQIDSAPASTTNTQRAQPSHRSAGYASTSHTAGGDISHPSHSHDCSSNSHHGGHGGSGE